MRTVVENRTKLYEPLKFDDRGFVYGNEYLPEPRSCFYDFGAGYPAAFAGYSAEPVSGFADTLEMGFYD